MLRWLTKRFWPRLYRAILKWQQDDGLTWAASLSYYAAFSFFPLVLVLLAAAGFVVQFWSYAQLKQESIVRLIGEQFSPALEEQVKKILEGVQTDAPVT